VSSAREQRGAASTPQRDVRRPSFVETLGLSPPRQRLREALIAIRGAPGVPPARYDVSSLSMLEPRLALPLWRGRFVIPRRAILSKLFNHRQTPIEDGWSVRRTQAEDFRGRDLTYDSHNGTDFCIPVGTVLLAPADGVVARVWAEFNRGGLKVAIDHGEGLFTSSAHLARALVREGDIVRAGDPIAVTGYSGLDGFITFPWGIPHVHFNCWLDGVPVDPFARPGEVSLWHGATPSPIDAEGAPRDDAEAVSANDWDAARVDAVDDWDSARIDAVVAACLHADTRRYVASLGSVERRARFLVAEMAYYPTRFADRGSLYRATHARRERLSMPFSAREFDGVVFRDEL